MKKELNPSDSQLLDKLLLVSDKESYFGLPNHKPILFKNSQFIKWFKNGYLKEVCALFNHEDEIERYKTLVETLESIHSFIGDKNIEKFVNAILVYFMSYTNELNAAKRGKIYVHSCQKGIKACDFLISLLEENSKPNPFGRGYQVSLFTDETGSILEDEKVFLNRLKRLRDDLDEAAGNERIWKDKGWAIMHPTGERKSSKTDLLTPIESRIYYALKLMGVPYSDDVTIQLFYGMGFEKNYDSPSRIEAIKNWWADQIQKM